MKTAHLVAARDIAQAVSTDAQFRMPHRPRFLPELVVVPLADGLLVSGTDEAQVFRGGAATTLLPRLIALLDGSADLDAVARALPDVAPEKVRNAVALLYSRGVLEEGGAPPHSGAAGLHPEAAGFYRRHVDTTRAHASVSTMLRALADSRAVVVAVGDTAEAQLSHMECSLRDGGVGTVERLDDRTPSPRPPGVVADVALVLADAGVDLSHLDDAFADAGIPWLHTMLDSTAGTAVLGPYFDRRNTVCYRCFGAGAASPAAAPAADAGNAEMNARILADLLVTQALYALSKVAPLAVGQTCTRYHTLDWTVDAEMVAPRRPGCRFCAGGGTEIDLPEHGGADVPPLVLAGVYEDLAGFAGHQIYPKAHQGHYQAQNIALASEATHYRCAPHLALPQGDPLRQLEALSRVEDGTLTLDAMGLLLRLTAGVRAFPEPGKAKLKRWAPSGGNLGSVELYLRAFDVEGLAPGTYYYDAHRHALAQLPEAGMDVADAKALVLRTFGGEVPPPAVLALGSAHHRVARKYGIRAYRVVHLDAGVALAQLEAVGAAIGIQVCSATHFDEALMERWLGLDSPLRLVTGFVGLRPAEVGRIHAAPTGRAQAEVG